MHKPQRWTIPAAFVLVSAVGLGTAQAANITASETIADIATLVGTQFDVTAFVATNGLEAADGTGAFLANQTATGQALVVLLEGVGGPFSDWFQIIYSSTAGGGFGTENVTVHWRSDANPGGLPPLPVGVVPQFLVETGVVQDITALLGASAAASGFAFPSNITIQVQSDPSGAEIPEPASIVLLGTGLLASARAAARKRMKR